MARFLLVRHAQSAWNEQGRWQGRADPPLSEHGRWQATAAAARVGAVDAVVASPLERARHTAEILAAHLGVGPVVLEPQLVERDVGPWSGLTRPEIEQEWPGFLEAGHRPPGFESDEQVVARAMTALVVLAGRFAGHDVLVVTHGGLIGTLERHHGEPSGRLANLSGRPLRSVRDGFAMGARLSLLDDDEQTVPAQL